MFVFNNSIIPLFFWRVGVPFVMILMGPYIKIALSPRNKRWTGGPS